MDQSRFPKVDGALNHTTTLVLHVTGRCLGGFKDRDMLGLPNTTRGDDVELGHPAYCIYVGNNSEYDLRDPDDPRGHLRHDAKCPLTGEIYDNACSGGCGFLMMRLLAALMPRDAACLRWDPKLLGSESVFAEGGTRAGQLNRFLRELIRLLVNCEAQARYEWQNGGPPVGHAVFECDKGFHRSVGTCLLSAQCAWLLGFNVHVRTHHAIARGARTKSDCGCLQGNCRAYNRSQQWHAENKRAKHYAARVLFMALLRHEDAHKLNHLRLKHAPRAVYSFVPAQLSSIASGSAGNFSGNHPGLSSSSAAPPAPSGGVPFPAASAPKTLAPILAIGSDKSPPPQPISNSSNPSKGRLLSKLKSKCHEICSVIY